ncbi:MAG: exodeoxyribonuclease VII large subunit [Candidatus Cloacimonadota bacterium]|nr:MAG: exodeoxyribonuclease VII large subunit [Candidatus Cloacimonadota bacterium]PIE78062.1 MAG: exodeoxyribonuclease VII large subunit [Candidatus Delongbacteria bacterium]
MGVDLFTYMNQEENREVKKSPQKVENSENKLLTVSQLSKKIKLLIESSLSRIYVEGEISNYKKHSSGHHYFSIKDEKSVINCVMWKSVRVDRSVVLESGKKVKIFGNVTIFEAGGKYQIDVKRIELTGVGDLQQQFEDLKKRLNEEGLFSPHIKKAIPKFVKKIGVVTAETGAAFQDIRKVVKSRAPFVEIVLYNARVQGEGAKEEIVQGIEALNKYCGDLDLIIVGRGGGSLEDLWCFNEECVARAIYKSKLPVISAVGHEIDFAISDFVADFRAATPSHAAEISTIDISEERKLLAQFDYRVKTSSINYFRRENDRLKIFENSHGFKRPIDMLSNHKMQLDMLEEKFNTLSQNFLTKEWDRVKNIEKLLNSLGHKSILKRGYSIVRKDNKIVKSSGGVSPKDNITIECLDGSYDAEVI